MEVCRIFGSHPWSYERRAALEVSPSRWFLDYCPILVDRHLHNDIASCSRFRIIETAALATAFCLFTWGVQYSSILGVSQIHSFSGDQKKSRLINYSNSWHQVLRGVLGNPASYICHDVLKIRNEFLARYIKLYLTFLISGLLHAAMDVAGGIPFNQQGSIRFLVTQAVGITAEDVVQSIYRKARGSGRKGSYPPISIRVVGSIWTLAFLVWSTPAWFYPEAHRRHMAPIKFSLITLASSYIKKWKSELDIQLNWATIWLPITSWSS